MHPRTYPKVGWILLIAILLAGLTFTPALAGDPAQTICEGNGGLWIGIDASTGSCYYPFNHALTVTNCGLIGVSWAVAYISDVESSVSCEAVFDLRGIFTGSSCFIWAGDFSTTFPDATCTISHDYFGDCPGSTIYHGVSLGGLYSVTHFECVAGAASSGGGQSGGNPGYGKFGGKITTDDAGSSHLGGHKNGSFYYAAGTCAAGCVFTPSLPGKAANSLPDGVVATLYVRLADGGTGSYSVCFDVTGIANPVIYRYVSGAWVAQPISFSGGQACTTASGDGAFALGG